jgi:LuxR family maltose regulon positive regulatory protein
MIEENIVNMLSQSEVPVLLSWIERLPKGTVREHPWIDVYRANTLALTGQVKPVEVLLAEVEERIQPDHPQIAELRGHIAAIRTYTANLQGDADRVIEMAAVTERSLPRAHVTARGMAAYALADAYLARDEIESARRAVQTMLEVGEKTDQLLMSVTALCDLAAVMKVQGRLYQAETFYNQAYDLMVARNGLTSRVRCAYEFGLADLLREWNRLDEAYDHAMIGIDYRQRLGGYLVVGDIVLTRILRARGDAEGALDVLGTAEQFMQTYYFQLTTTIEFRTTCVFQWLSVGDVQTAAYWAETCTGGSELEEIALARVRLAEGRAHDALHLLDQQRPMAEAGGRAGRLIEILGLQAIALEALGRSEEAEVALSQALSAARPERYRRLFLDMGEPLRELLERCVARDGPQPLASSAPPLPRAYAADLLAAFQREIAVPGHLPETTSRLFSGDGVPIDVLTPRELDVLQLLAEGLTNKAIAGKLIVAPSTVKQHLKNIYSKLDVHSRTQAVARGRDLGYL